MEHIWDSKLYAWSKITKAAKTINAIWDKATKKFIDPVSPVIGPPPKQEAPADGYNPASSGTKGAAPPDTLEQKYREATVEIGNILNSTMETGERIFADSEVNIINGRLAGFLKNPPETRLALINKLLNEQKVLLQQRIKYLADITTGAEESPAMKQTLPTPATPPVPANVPPELTGISSMYKEQEPDDNFVNDIPWQENTLPKKPSGEELDIF
jgi:hypothetical protein